MCHRHLREEHSGSTVLCTWLMLIQTMVFTRADSFIGTTAGSTSSISKVVRQSMGSKSADAKRCNACYLRRLLARNPDSIQNADAASLAARLGGLTDTFWTAFGPLLSISTVFPQLLTGQQSIVSKVSSSLDLTLISRSRGCDRMGLCTLSTASNVVARAPLASSLWC